MLDTYTRLPKNLYQLPSGAVLLYERSFFPWGGLPYPKEHAELGLHLSEIDEYREISQRMADFQLAAIDHAGRPLYSFFQQESGCFFEELELANNRFFERLGVARPSVYSYIDRDLGMLSKRDAEKTLVLLATGCKTGMGSYLYKDAGIISFAPQIRPIGECSGFGLSAKPLHLEMSHSDKEFRMRYQNRLAFPLSRNTGLAWLSDSGYSGMWFTAHLQATENALQFQVEMEGFRPLSELAFSFFCKAASCVVARTQKLSPRSLDRYLGPPQSIELRGKEGRVSLEPINGFSQMEIIPLAGDQGFWGSDFLIAFSFKSPLIEAVIKN